MLKGTIIDVSGRKVKVLIVDDNVSTAFIECLNSIEDSDLQIGKTAIILFGTSYNDSIVIGVVG